MAAGYKLRRIQAAERRAEQPCECGHPRYVHREYPTDDPRYRPLLFRCAECECEHAP